MTVDRRALVGALAALLLVAACGGSATQAPGATPAPGATEAPAETQVANATQEPVQTQEPTEGPEASFTAGAAGGLEAMLPDEAGGVKLQKASFDGASFPGGIPVGEGDDDMVKFLNDNGKSIGDVKVAVATPLDASAAGSTVMAIQIEGVPSDKLLAWVAKDQTDSEKTNIGGKDVYGAAAAGFGAYYYVKDDIVFYIIVVGETDLAASIISQLP